MRTLLEYIRPRALRVAVATFIKLLGTVAELMLPFLLGYLVDDVSKMNKPALIYFWGAVMIAFSVACVVCNIVANRKAAAVARDVTRSLRHDLYSKIAHLSGAQVDHATVPSLVSRLTTDTYNVHQMVGMVQRMGVRAPILLFGGLMFSFFQDPTLALILLAVTPLIGVSVTMVSKRGIPLFRVLQESLDGLVRIVRENVTGARVIKALSMSAHENERFKAQSDRVADDNVRANVIMSLSSPFVTLFLNLGLVCVLIAGAYRVEGNLTAAGKIMSFLSYFTIISNGMLGLTRIFVVVSRASASAKRIEDILVLPVDLSVIEDGAKPKGDCHVEFDGVTFSYNKRKPAVSDISFRLRRGESLGIIGATGSGKSTIIKLLMRLYDADSGRILINGTDVRAIAESELHSMFGVTFQSDIVYTDTARENIALGRDIDEESIERAVKVAQADYLFDMPEGLDSHLNSQGTNISGGQRQRLLIARALAGKPDILILDDASSALDYRTDANLRTALRENYSHTTSVIIASRVSSVAACTLVMVLSEGRAVGLGTHDELMKTNEYYRQIAETQMGVEQ